MGAGGTSHGVLPCVGCCPPAGLRWPLQVCLLPDMEGHFLQGSGAGPQRQQVSRKCSLLDVPCCILYFLHLAVSLQPCNLASVTG